MAVTIITATYLKTGIISVFSHILQYTYTLILKYFENYS